MVSGRLKRLLSSTIYFLISFLEFLKKKGSHLLSFLVYIRLSCSQFTSPLLKLKVSLFLKLLFSLFSFVPQFGKGGELPLPGKCNLRSFELKKQKKSIPDVDLKEREVEKKKEEVECSC